MLTLFLTLENTCRILCQDTARIPVEGGGAGLCTWVLLQRGSGCGHDTDRGLWRIPDPCVSVWI